jgi:mRNA-degrading endonuclease RelE of RelBE toxin-antitoxin system
MSYNIIATPEFKRELKSLVKKYRSLKSEFSDLIDDLKENPQQGTAIGHNCFKIRLAISSKGKGKSGGARVITSVFVTDKEVYLISIYDKSEKESIPDAEIKKLVKSLGK